MGKFRKLSSKNGSGGEKRYSSTCGCPQNITPVVLQLRLLSSASSCHLTGTRHNSPNVSWQPSEHIEITSPSETKAGPLVSLGTQVTLRLSCPVRREERKPVKQVHFVTTLPRQILSEHVPKCPCFRITIGIKWAVLEGGGGGAGIRWPVTPAGSARLFRSHPPLSN